MKKNLKLFHIREKNLKSKNHYHPNNNKKANKKRITNRKLNLSHPRNN